MKTVIIFNILVPLLISAINFNYPGLLRIPDDYWYTQSFQSGINFQNVEKRIFLPDSLGGLNGAREMCYNWIENKMYVAGGGYPGVIIIDCNTNKRIARIFLDCPPIWTTSNPGDTNAGGARMGLSSILFNALTNRIYCPLTDSTLVVIDGHTNQILKRIRTPYWLTQGLVNYQLNKIYYTSWDSAFIHAGVQIIDGRNDSLLKFLPVLGAYAMILDSIDNKLYCATIMRRDSNVAVIDCVKDSIIEYIRIFPESPGDTIFTGWMMAWNSRDNKVYIPATISKWPPGEYSYVIVVDCSNDSIIKQIAMPTNTFAACYLCWAPKYNKLYTGSDEELYSDNYLTVIDCFRDSIIKVIYLNDTTPRSLFWDPDYNRIYVPLYCYRKMAYMSFILDGEQDTIIKKLHFATQFNRNWYNDLAYIPRGIFVSLFDRKNMAIIDKIPTGISPEYLVFNESANKIYSLNRRPAGFTVINCDNQSVIKNFEINRAMQPFVSSGEGPIDAYYSPVSNKIYCPMAVGFDTFGIAVIDCRNDSLSGIQLIRFRHSYPRSFIFNPVNNRIYINFNNDSLTVFDCATDTILRQVYFPQGLPILWVYNPVNNKIYGGYDSGRVVISCVSDTPVKYIRTGFSLAPIIYNSRDNSVFFQRDHKGWLLEVDGATDSIIDSIYVGTLWPDGMYYNPRNNCIYYQYLDSFKIIDCSQDTVVAQIYIGYSRPQSANGIFFDSLRNHVWIANEAHPTALIIDGWTHRVIDSLTITHTHDMCWNNRNDRLYASHTGPFISVINCEVGIEETEIDQTIPVRLNIMPNPCRDRARIHFYLSGRVRVTLKVFDVVGRRIANLINSKLLDPGHHEVLWNTKNQPQGVYFIHFTSQRRTTIKKIVLVK